MTKTSKLTIASIAACNYLPRARVMAQSLRKYHPGVEVELLLVDSEDYLPIQAEPFHISPLTSARVPRLGSFIKRYTLKQRCSALKPFWLQSLLDRGLDAVLFLDPDTLITANLDPLLTAIQQHPLLLTPHMLRQPLSNNPRQREQAILQAGIFNAGLIGISECPEARQFLAWWQKRLETHAQDSIAQGMYYDQRWLDLVPALFQGTFVLRDSGYNVAYWNLAERPLSLRAGLYYAGESLCRVIHFSGYEPDQTEYLSRHADWIEPSEDDVLMQIIEDYRQRLQRAGASSG